MLAYFMTAVGWLLNMFLFESGYERISQQTQSQLFDVKIKDIWGKQFGLNYLKDKRLTLIVNVASQCGFTNNHYSEMVKSYEKWKDQGFQILAVPCNQFKEQQPGQPFQIFDFASKQFNANFPLLEKIQVNGNNTHPLYSYLRTHSQLYDPSTETARVIPWNFAKFFINSEGTVIKYFPPEVSMDTVAEFIDSQMTGKENSSDL